MSRNNDIKYLHYITGDPYSICRKKLKAAKWSLELALYFAYILSNINIRVFDYYYRGKLSKAINILKRRRLNSYAR